MKKITLLLFIAISFINTSKLFAEGYQIKVKINGLQDTTIILGHYFGGSMYPDDTIRVNKNGEGIFKGKELLPGGMYLIFLPSRDYFDIIINDDQSFSLETDTSQLSQNLEIKGCLENELLVQYQRFLIEKKEEGKALNSLLKETEDEVEKEKLRTKFDSLSKVVDNYAFELINNNDGTFFSKFLMSAKDIEVPDFPRDEQGNVTDSSFKYKYYKAHYFDNLDISDPRMLRTPMYNKKVMNYIDKVIPQIPDSIITAVDFLLEKTKTDEELYRFMLVSLFNKYAQSKIMGMDAVYIHIAENYYIPDASWSDPKFISDLKERVEKSKPTLIGKVAPNVELIGIPKEHFIQAENDTALQKNPYVGSPLTIQNVEAKFTVLVFWECDCGHCKKAIPKLHEFYPELKEKGVEILAIHMLGGREGKQEWVEFVNKHKIYDWVNCWNPYSYEYKLKYDVNTTPSVYILDENKKIIAKRLGVEQIPEVIDFELTHKK